MTTNQYEELLLANVNYNKSNDIGNYELYRDRLFELFDGEDDDAILRGMIWFMKPEHQCKFDEDMKRKTRWKR